MRLSVLLVVLMAGCHIGPQLQNMPELSSPFGAQIEVLINAGSQRQALSGELIAVDDQGLVLLMRDVVSYHLVFSPWSTLRRLETLERDRFAIRVASNRLPESRYMERLQRICRYPQGLSDEILAALLSRYNQDALEIR